MIGSFGDVVFIATPETIRTFTDLSRSSAGRWGKHEILGQKPISQFIGPGLDTITFNMRFDSRYGLNPRKELDALVGLERSGKAVALTIGGKGLGTGLWIITSLSQTWDVVDNNGNVVVGNASISIEEYVAVIK